MRACVTGATGMIGAALVRRLLRDGVQVQALVRSPEKSSPLSSAGVDVTIGDVTDAAAAARAVTNADVVFHLAAQVAGSGTRENFLAANATGTARVVEAAASTGTVKRVIYSSSIAVYGRIAHGEHIDESTPLDASPGKRDAYSHSKILAEESAVAIAQRSGTPLTVIRPGIVYGPAHSPPAGLIAFRAGKTDVVFAQPDWHFPLMYVENLVDALIRAAEQPAAEKLQDFNVVDDDGLTLGAYHDARNAIERTRTIFLSPNPVLAAASIFGGIAGAITPAASGFNSYQLGRSLQDRIYDTQKIRTVLAWAPRVPLREALTASLGATSPSIPGSPSSPK